MKYYITRTAATEKYKLENSESPLNPGKTSFL
jgi:hypothetical protein